MASPFADFPNIRLGWRRPTAAPTSLRDGLSSSSQVIAIDGYLSGKSIARGRPGGEADGLPTIVTPGERSAKVFIIRWALVPLGESCFHPGTSWAWDDSGLRPAGMTAGDRELQVYFGDLAAIATPPAGSIGTAVIDQVGGPSGDGGVGAVLREEAGDQLFVTLRFPR